MCVEIVTATLFQSQSWRKLHFIAAIAVTERGRNGIGGIDITYVYPRCTLLWSNSNRRVKKCEIHLLQKTVHLFYITNLQLYLAMGTLDLNLECCTAVLSYWAWSFQANLRTEWCRYTWSLPYLPSNRTQIQINRVALPTKPKRYSVFWNSKLEIGIIDFWPLDLVLVFIKCASNFKLFRRFYIQRHFYKVLWLPT